jgi:hypothetical protein
MELIVNPVSIISSIEISKLIGKLDIEWKTTVSDFF